MEYKQFKPSSQCSKCFLWKLRRLQSSNLKDMSILIFKKNKSSDQVRWNFFRQTSRLSPPTHPCPSCRTGWYLGGNLTTFKMTTLCELNDIKRRTEASILILDKNNYHLNFFLISLSYFVVWLYLGPNIGGWNINLLRFFLSLYERHKWHFIY